MRYCRAILILAVLIAGCLVAAFAARMPMLALIGLGAIAVASRKGLGLTAFGTARWANAEELERAGMLSDKPGLILGHIACPKPRFFSALKGLFDRRVPPGQACERFVLSMRKLQPRPNTALVRLSNAVHTAVFAPTGVGKGVSCVIPHLLNCPDSMVVVDFKGENAYLTAEHRARVFGHKIVILDPFDVVTKNSKSEKRLDRPSGTFNPLDQIDASSPLLIDDCRALAEALVIRSGNETEPHWNDSAEAWISGMAAVAALCGHGYQLKLITGAHDASDLPNDGKEQVVLADIAGVLRIRIFGGDGTIVVDTDESQLPQQSARIADLKRSLIGLWDLAEVERKDATEIVSEVSLITGYAKAKQDRSLQTVRTILTSPARMAAVIKLMCESEAAGGMLARMGNQLTYYKEKELNSVLTTTNRHLNFLDTLAVAESTTRSSFDPADLCKGKMTVYLVLPPEHMRTQSSLLRMWINACLRAVVRGGLQETNKVHFVLDEAASLGQMSILDDAVDKYRGYGVRLLFFYQSLGQLQKCWGEGGDQTLLSNTTQIFFGVNDQQTAEHVSNRLGEATIIVDSGGSDTGGSRSSSSQDPDTSTSTSWGKSASWAQEARKLLKPEEVVNLSPRLAITFTPGVPPVLTRLTRYYEQPSLGKGRWQRVRWIAEVWLTAVLFLFLTTAVMVAGLQAGLLR